MSIKEILLIKRVNFGIITFTGALIVALAAWILVSALSSGSDVDLGSLKSSSAHAPLLAKNQSREPSSLIGVEPRVLPAVAHDNKIETLSLGCIHDGAKLNLKSHANQVRIRAGLCDSFPLALGQSSIVNRANGFEATLFKLERGGFSTDYMMLADGSNSLLLTVENNQGERAVAELTISKSQGL